jgi:hypothetical protein
MISGKLVNFPSFGSKFPPETYATSIAFEEA